MIRLLSDSVENGATVEDTAVELSMSPADAEARIAGESILRRRLLDPELN